MIAYRIVLVEFRSETEEARKRTNTLMLRDGILASCQGAERERERGKLRERKREREGSRKTDRKRKLKTERQRWDY